MSLNSRFIVDGWYVVIGINPNNLEIKSKSVIDTMNEMEIMKFVKELNDKKDGVNYFAYRINSSEVM